MNNLILRLGLFLSMCAVILGAFGAHALKKMVDLPSLEIWHKAVLYQFIHAFALLICGMLCHSYRLVQIKRAAVMFTIGIVLFSGSLYILTFAKVSSVNLLWAGPLTPLGGLSFIAGWVLLLVAKPEVKTRERSINN